MKIVICGSMAFAQEMLDCKKYLENKGCQVVVPDRTEEYINDPHLKERISSQGSLEGAKRKIERDLIRKHYNEIRNGNAVLILNMDKRGIKNYIGGNSFLEMGFAYIQKKPIYLYNPIPEDLTIFYQEILAMQPIILSGDLDQISLQD